MKVIGIVGGIGSGKSYLSEMMANLYGAYVIEADQVGHMAMAKDGSAYKIIVEAFSEAILDETGMIDRQKLGDIVFNDEEALKKLNAIVHKEVFDYLRTHVEYLRENPMYDYVIIEAALLIVDEFMPLIDDLWYVHTDKETRIERLIEHREMSRERILSIMDQQHTDAFYQEHADFVIDNNATQEALVLEMNRIIETYWRRDNES